MAGHEIHEHEGRVVAGIRREAGRVAEVEAGVRDHFFQILFRDGVLHQLFDLGDDGRGFLDARAFRRADGHREVAGIDLGKEFGVEAGNEQ